MNISFKKNINIVVYDVLLNVEFEEYREDVQDFLHAFVGKDVPNDGFGSKITSYLEEIGLANKSQGTLTEKGKRTMDTGLFAAKEQGVYRAWIIKDDPLLETRILALNRVTIPNHDGKRNKIDNRNKNNIEKLPTIHSYMQTVLIAEEDTNNRQNYQVRKTDIKLLHDIQESDRNNDPNFLERLKGTFVQYESNNQNYLIIKSDSDTQLSISLKGNLSLKIKGSESGCDANLDQLEFDSSKLDFFDLIQSAFNANEESSDTKYQEWDSNSNQLSVLISDLENEEMERGIRKEMSFDVDESFFGGDGQIIVTNIPLLANDLEVAKKWRNKLLISYLEIEYRTPQEWNLFLSKKHKNFNPIKSYLEKESLPSKDDLEIEIKDNRISFWHLFAPIDLQP